MNDSPEPTPSVPLVVHILLMGQALCGQEGLPCDWPEGHKWVAVVHDPDLKDANCPRCVARHKELALA